MPLFNTYNLTDNQTTQLKNGTNVDEIMSILNGESVSVVIYKNNLVTKWIICCAPFNDKYKTLPKLLKSNKNIIYYSDLNSNFFSDTDSSISLTNIIEHINEYFAIPNNKFSQRIFFGFSMGGYATLYLSKFFNSPDRFIAINPITFKNKDYLDKINYLNEFTGSSSNTANGKLLATTPIRTEDIIDLRKHLSDDTSTSYKLICVGMSECAHSNDYYHGDLFNAGYLFNVSNINIAFIDQLSHQGFKYMDINNEADENNFYNIIFTEEAENIGKNIKNIKYFDDKRCINLNSNFKCGFQTDITTKINKAQLIGGTNNTNKYYNKYLKYKQKYLNLQKINKFGGTDPQNIEEENIIFNETGLHGNIIHNIDQDVDVNFFIQIIKYIENISIDNLKSSDLSVVNLDYMLVIMSDLINLKIHHPQLFNEINQIKRSKVAFFKTNEFQKTNCDKYKFYCKPNDKYLKSSVKCKTFKTNNDIILNYNHSHREGMIINNLNEHPKKEHPKYYTFMITNEIRYGIINDGLEFGATHNQLSKNAGEKGIVSGEIEWTNENTIKFNFASSVFGLFRYYTKGKDFSDKTLNLLERVRIYKLMLITRKFLIESNPSIDFGKINLFWREDVLFPDNYPSKVELRKLCEKQDLFMYEGVHKGCPSKSIDDSIPDKSILEKYKKYKEEIEAKNNSKQQTFEFEDKLLCSRLTQDS